MTIGRKITLLTAALAATATLVTGCDVLRDNEKPTTQQETDEAARRLQQRPSLEEAEAQLQQVMEQIAAAGTELVPAVRFEWVDDRSMPDCDAPYDRTYGRKVFMRKLWAQGQPYPEAEWPAFLAKAKELAATVGATWSQQIREEPSGTTGPAPSNDPAAPEYGRHDINFVNPDNGTTVRIMTNKATVITATLGCHLPKDRLDDPIKPTR
ncbi:LppA family lipoprotein [Nocardia crassostreae]|uniref:LppA family lipoprotein n=1 Tax=Nocardia crassostreae TaxID=53428 RepID=UPI0008309B5E|nr:LppA family lipoprotein [Nocardia crassostreae]